MTDATLTAPQIAVIIPCYNHADVLRRTLDALAAQTLLPSEVVVVEDGSAEPSKDIVEAFRLSHPILPIEYVAFETNRGAPAARNEGARRTIAPFLLFLDADAELVPSGLQQLSETLQAHPEAAFAYANMYWGKVAMPAKAFDLQELRRRNYIHTSSLIRREAFPGFDESIKKFQDWDLWLTIAELGGVGIWLDQFLFHIDTRPHVGAMSKWMPSIMHKIPWPILGWMPKEIRKYRTAEKIIREKHKI